MRAVISVIGNDSVGILAKVSTECVKANANVLEVTQSVLQEYFAMIMVIEITNINCELQTVEKNIKSQVRTFTKETKGSVLFFASYGE